MPCAHTTQPHFRVVRTVIELAQPILCCCARFAPADFVSLDCRKLTSPLSTPDATCLLEALWGEYTERAHQSNCALAIARSAQALQFVRKNPISAHSRHDQLQLDEPMDCPKLFVLFRGGCPIMYLLSAQNFKRSATASSLLLQSRRAPLAVCGPPL